MVAGSMLPIGYKNGKIMFLFGKENSLEDSSKGWSDFGGGCENNETPLETAFREGGEELTFFLGDGNDIKEYVSKNGGVFPIVHDTYHFHLFYKPYDPKLPEYYNNNHRHLWKHMNKDILNKSKLFEKIEIQWFSINDIRRRIKEFRGFFQEKILYVLSKLPEIEDFFKPMKNSNGSFESSRGQISLNKHREKKQRTIRRKIARIRNKNTKRNNKNNINT